ncbi:hypothetical protein Tco_0691017 [Tanacetum coccineum]
MWEEATILDLWKMKNQKDAEVESYNLMPRNRLVLTKPKLSAIVVIRHGILLESADPRGIKTLVNLDGEGVDWTSHSEDEQENYALMAAASPTAQHRDASIEIQAYIQALKKVKAQLMSARDKAGLGYGDQMNKDIFEGMHAVPPPMTGNYMPSGPDIEIDESQFTYGNYMPSGPDREVDDSMFTYGPKQSKTSESDTQTSNFDSCESNSSVETLESVPEPVVVEPKVVSQPKVWSDAPIIEEYESDSDDEYVIQPSKEQEKPSFAFVNTVKHVKTPRETVKEQNTYSPSPKANKRDWNGLMSKRLGLGYGFTKKACFVCGSFSHLIRDCDFHEKRMAKQVELNKKKGKGTGQGENRPVWNNVQRLNHQNKFVPTAVLTRTGRIPVNTARHNFNSQAVSTSTARKVNTARPIVNEIRPRNNFYKSHSPIRRPFNRTTTPRTKFSNQKVNTAGDKAVSAVGGKRETAVKPSAGCNWRPKRHYWNKFSKYNGGSNSRKCDNPQRALKNKGIVDSGCSRHMTGNKAYLAEYQDYNGGPVAFGGSKGYITGKGEVEKKGAKYETKDYNKGMAQNVDAARQEDSVVEPKTTPTTTSIFDDGSYHRLAQTLIKKKKKRKLRKKEVSIKDIEDFFQDLTRSFLTLKPHFQ